VHWSLGNSGFRVLRNKTLDHQIREIAKFDLPKYKRGKFLEVIYGYKFLEREIREPLLRALRASGRRAILSTWTFDLRVGRLASPGW
jgi:hypothetical protein